MPAEHPLNTPEHTDSWVDVARLGRAALGGGSGIRAVGGGSCTAEEMQQAVKAAATVLSPRHESCAGPAAVISQRGLSTQTTQLMRGSAAVIISPQLGPQLQQPYCCSWTGTRRNSYNYATYPNPDGLPC